MKSAHLIREKEFTSWPTPTVAEAEERFENSIWSEGLEQSSRSDWGSDNQTKDEQEPKGREDELANSNSGIEGGTSGDGVETNSTGFRPRKKKNPHDGKTVRLSFIADKVQLEFTTPQVSDMNGAANPNREAHRVQLRDVESWLW